MDNDNCSPDWQVQFYVSLYAHTRSMLHELIQCFLKKRIINMGRVASSRMEFQKLSGEREDEGYKGNMRTF
ncbi:hypothetical protein HKD37_18G050720 [Glycine soja]